MVTKRQPLAAGSAHRADRGPAGLQGGRRTGWRPDLALCVAVVGLLVGVLVLIPLLQAVTPGPPSLLSSPGEPSGSAPSGSPGVRRPVAMATYRSGSGVVARGVAYAPLSATRTTSVTLPGSPAAAVRGNLVIVKLVVRGVSASPSTASVGLVDLVAGGVAYRPLLPVAAALSNTRWQTLVLKRLTAGASRRVKLVFEVPAGPPTGLQLRVGSHSPGARRFAVPVGPPA